MSSPRRRPAAGSTPTMNVVGRPISAHFVTRSLRIWSVVGASAVGNRAEEGAAATGGRTAAAADSEGERLGWKRAARRVIREAGVAKHLKCRDTEDLVRSEKRVLKNGDLARLDPFGTTHADLADEAVPAAIVARGVAVRAIVDGLTSHL